MRRGKLLKIVLAVSVFIAVGAGMAAYNRFKETANKSTAASGSDDTPGSVIVFESEASDESEAAFESEPPNESEASDESVTAFESESSDESETVPESTYEPDYWWTSTDMTPLYCTIWPIMPLDIVDSPQEEGTKIGDVPAGSALCVLAEEGGYFRIRYGRREGYIDSRFCMINLPEYIGSLCEYYIENASSSIFRIHGYDIPDITGNVIKGYENIRLGDGELLVPYLYPCVGKLYRAVKSAAADGYILRIYDAFRPNEATRFLFDTVKLLIDTPVEPESELTFQEVMTDGRWQLPSFLAASVSAHNMGIALDLTLVDMQTGEELAMQSDMHDLSWHSSLQYNNNEAGLLAKYMKDAGFMDLASEWWHFQDNETRDEIELRSYLKGGVSVQGWKKDDVGWKYRLNDGSFYTDVTVSIDGSEYTFDTDGYQTGQVW